MVEFLKRPQLFSLIKDDAVASSGHLIALSHRDGGEVETRMNNLKCGFTEFLPVGPPQSLSGPAGPWWTSVV